MKRVLFAAVVVLVGLVSTPAFAQTAQTFEYQSNSYHVVSHVDAAHAQQVAHRLEAMAQLYNTHFRFPMEDLSTRMRVRIFADKQQYDAYLRRVLNETREGFVYLHYRDLAKSELVGYQNETLGRSFVHQAFVQYLRAFIANPPLWLREGFAVYFEAVEYDADFDAAIYRENLAWLETLRSIVERGGTSFTLESLLALSIDEARTRVDEFYPIAWGMVSYLLNTSQPEVNRILWDSISALDPNASLAENGSRVYRQAFRWADPEGLVEGFVDYVTQRRSFRGWVEYGAEQYGAGNMDGAERAFVQAIALNGTNYVPYYYLGLINYERQNYELADYYYQSALSRGADESITLYALGVNAYAANRFEDAISYLEMTIERDPAFRDRAENILVRMRS